MFYFFFLRLALAFLLAASFFSTAAGSAFTSPRASWLNLFHPSGFFGDLPCCKLH